jgi:hypothetical protein
VQLLVNIRSVDNCYDVRWVLQQVWKAAGMDMSRVEFRWTSEEINKRSDEYWTQVMDIARRFQLKRIMRYVGAFFLL